MATKPRAAEQLTPRERDVLELLRLGLTNREIAERLNMSVDGAKYHVSEIIGKLGVRNRYEAAAWPERRAPWLLGLAPVGLLWRRASHSLPSRAGAIAALVAGALLVAVLVVLSTIGVLLARQGDDTDPPAPESTATPCDLEAVTAGPEYGTMQLLNGSTGWVLVDQRLKWTDDGGESWRDITPPDLEFSDAMFDAGELAYFLDPSTGWVLATRPRGLDRPSDLMIWRTTNGGASWQRTTLDAAPGDGTFTPPVFNLRALQFVDAQRGWFALSFASGNLGGASFYSTDDGGTTWSEVAGLQGFNGSAGNVHFANASDGWISWIGQEIDAYVTHDGGSTWEGMAFAPPSSIRLGYAWQNRFGSGDLAQAAELSRPITTEATTRRERQISTSPKTPG